MRIRSGSIPLDQMEMTVHTEYRQHGTSQMTRFTGTDTQDYKAHEVKFGGDVESGPEKR
jgi:hypothetical protein